MTEGVDGRIALRVVIALVSALESIQPNASKLTTEVLRRQLETAEDEDERLDLTIAVGMLDRIAALPR